LRTRKDPLANYSAVFINGKTLRIPIDKTKEITELRFPEFYDISTGNKCATGKCDFCYASASPHGKHYRNLVEKVEKFFGTMSLNERPFQVAIGGEQEPLENPEIWDMIKRLGELGIVANYTTNGVLVNKRVAELTKAHCGGVAITLHPHLEVFWRRAISIFRNANVKINVHTIISDKNSIDYTKRLYNELLDDVDYFVLLPFMNYGHAKTSSTTIDYKYFLSWVDTIHNDGKIAFGANFYNLLKENNQYNVSLYPPEIMSKYIIFDEEMYTNEGKITIYNNSFDKKAISFSFTNGCELGTHRKEFISF
jgi:sulfatase maturation enzyme AslB (radical SAM superfamily)